MPALAELLDQDTVSRLDGDRCLPGDAYGQLVAVDGAWMTRAAASQHGRP